MTLKMRLGLPPFIRDENGHIPMFDGTANWLVIVTREALDHIAALPEAPLDRLLRHADTFGSVATYKLEHGRAGAEETIWVQKADVVEYRTLSNSASD